MADLKIRVYKGGGADPETTVTIPGGILKMASALIPKPHSPHAHNLS